MTSLNVQGGPFDKEGVEAFRRNPYWAEAARLRVWDDLAKDPEVKTPGLESYCESLEGVVLEGRAR